MLINKLDIATEFFFWLLLFGITFSNAMVEITIGFIIFLFVLRRVILKKLKPPVNPLNIILLIFFIIVFISFLRSAYFKESVRGAVRPLKYMLLYFALVEFLQEDKRRLKRSFWVIMAVSVFTYLNAIFQGFFGFDIMRHRQLIQHDYLRRLSASFVHPNDFAAYIICVLPLTFVIFSRRISKAKRIIIFLVFILGSFCLVRTASRGAWLGFLFGVMAFFFFYKRRFCLLIPIIMLLVIFVAPHGFDRITSIFDLEHNTVWERAQLWKGTWNMVREHPILGFGVNTFSEYFPKYKPPDYPDVRYTHNSYLQMWSEIGIIGLFAFMALIFATLRFSFRNWKKKLSCGPQGILLLGMIAGYLAFLIQSAFDTNLFSLVLVTNFWILNAYIISLSKAIDDRLHG